MKGERLGIFFIAVVLIAGMLGCDSNGRESLTLTIDNTAGGVVTVNNVTILEKSILTYDAGTVVSLNATPDSGYQFVRWTGDVYTIANVNASSTIIIMNGDYYICAHFREISMVC